MPAFCYAGIDSDFPNVLYSVLYTFGEMNRLPLYLLSSMCGTLMGLRPLSLSTGFCAVAQKCSKIAGFRGVVRWCVHGILCVFHGILCSKCGILCGIKEAFFKTSFCYVSIFVMWW